MALYKLQYTNFNEFKNMLFQEKLTKRYVNDENVDALFSFLDTLPESDEKKMHDPIEKFKDFYSDFDLTDIDIKREVLQRVGFSGEFFLYKHDDLLIEIADFLNSKKSFFLEAGLSQRAVASLLGNLIAGFYSALVIRNTATLKLAVMRKSSSSLKQLFENLEEHYYLSVALRELFLEPWFKNFKKAIKYAEEIIQTKRFQDLKTISDTKISIEFSSLLNFRSIYNYLQSYTNSQIMDHVFYNKMNEDEVVMEIVKMLDWDMSFHKIPGSHGINAIESWKKALKPISLIHFFDTQPASIPLPGSRYYSDIIIKVQSDPFNQVRRRYIFNTRILFDIHSIRIHPDRPNALPSSNIGKMFWDKGKNELVQEKTNCYRSQFKIIPIIFFDYLKSTSKYDYENIIIHSLQNNEFMLNVFGNENKDFVEEFIRIKELYETYQTPLFETFFEMKEKESILDQSLSEYFEEESIKKMSFTYKLSLLYNFNSLFRYSVRRKFSDYYTISDSYFSQARVKLSFELITILINQLHKKIYVDEYNDTHGLIVNGLKEYYNQIKNDLIPIGEATSVWDLESIITKDIYSANLNSYQITNGVFQLFEYAPERIGKTFFEFIYDSFSMNQDERVEDFINYFRVIEFYRHGLQKTYNIKVA